VSVGTIQCWELRSPGEPLVRAERTAVTPGPGHVLIEIAGCGVCHTDVGYHYEGVKPRHALPLTLGHEIAGTVVEAPDDAALVGRKVVVPAVIPCGACDLCRRDKGMICRQQVFPGCDVHGGFASHVVVPAHGLCAVDDAALERSGLELADLSVLGDAVSTAYQSIVRSELRGDDVAIFVGAGGVGSFGVQIARAFGAHVIALDVDEGRLERIREFGAAHTIAVGGLDAKAVKKQVRDYVKERGLTETCWKIYECSGSAAGQSLAYGLLTFGSVLGVVGYTLDTLTVRLSNLMAFDARAIGNWGCLPELYPEVLEMVLGGRVKVTPFVERVPMSQVNEVMVGLRDHKLSRRPVLIPDFGGAP
jgi:6-hydroxycyclohex-1-ene-1-carbonyl-CoA dehydrogenase